METATSSNQEVTQNISNPEAVLNYVLSFQQISDLRNREREAFYAAQANAYDNGVGMSDAMPLGEEAALRVRNEYVTHIAESDIFDEDSLKSIDAIVDKYSFLTMSDANWRVPETTDDGTVIAKNGIDRLHDDLIELRESHAISKDTATQENPTPEIIDPAIEAAREHLNLLRNNLAVLSAKRQGRIGGGGGDAYETALKEYKDQVNKLGRLEKAELIANESIDESEKSREVAKYIFEEQNRLRDESLEALKGTKISGFVEGFAKLMDAKTRRGRIAKTVIFGGAVGLATGATLAAFGATGAIVAPAVIAAGATLKFARAWAVRDAKQGRGLKALDESEQNVDLAPEHDEDLAMFRSPADNTRDLFDRLQAHFDDKFEEDTQKEQNKRLRAAGLAMGTIAVGLIAGAAAHYIVDGLTGGFDADAKPDVDHEPSVPEDTPEDAPLEGDTNGDGIVDELDAPDSVPEVAPVVPDPNFYIESGEGGIHFFQDMGLTESDWYSIDDELLQNFPQDFYSMGGGEVGLAHPGQLSIEAQEFIKARFPQLSYGLAA